VKESATTPYLIRAIYEWCCDNGLTPYIAVKVDESTRVPAEYVKNGEIVLNASPDATRNLKIGNDLIQFSARFGGTSREISVPIAAVAGIFAKETGHGLAFQTSSSLPAPVVSRSRPLVHVNVSGSIDTRQRFRTPFDRPSKYR